ncbi:cytochrome c biogenesis CcdA family protein [Acidisoma sp. C75]
MSIAGFGASLGAGFLAGVLSTLSPCVFPLLPLVVGAATATGRFGAFWLAAGVATSFTLAGLFVATVGFAIGLDGGVLRSVSAILLVILGVMLLSTAAQTRLGIVTGTLTNAADRLSRMLSVSAAPGQAIIGLLLGLVWSPCVGPTLGAASLLAAQGKDLPGVAGIMLAFGIGTTIPLILVAILSRHVLLRWRRQALTVGRVGKLAMGVSAIAVGLLILSGTDRYIETRLVQASPAWLTMVTTYF